MNTIFVPGTPAPQGSKRVGVNRATGRAVLIEASKQVKPWRAAVVEAWKSTGRETIPGPVAVWLRFDLVRPRGHYGTGRNARTLRPTAPAYPAVKPDLDKLVRSILDALTTAGAIEDDARVVSLSVSKHYAPVGGVHITINPKETP